VRSRAGAGPRSSALVWPHGASTSCPSEGPPPYERRRDPLHHARCSRSFYRGVRAGYRGRWPNAGSAQSEQQNVGWPEGVAKFRIANRAANEIEVKSGGGGTPRDACVALAAAVEFPAASVARSIGCSPVVIFGYQHPGAGTNVGARAGGNVR
jgi:hypothetical protein